MATRQRASRYPCGVCRSNCFSDCVMCGNCKVWFHSKCERIDKLESWSSVEGDYICWSCRTTDGTDFDYLMGIHRLESAAKTRVYDKLRDAVKRELLFNPPESLPSGECKTSSAGIDLAAAQILADNKCDVNGTPINTTGDGDCLFNAVSILMCGNETLSVKLRYLTCIKLVVNRETFMKHPRRNEIQTVCCSYEKATMDCAVIGKYSSSWTVVALTDVISRPLRVIYPPYNSNDMESSEAMDCLYTPTCDVTESRPLHVLFLRIGQVPVPGQFYTVNHFCAVRSVTAKVNVRATTKVIRLQKLKVNHTKVVALVPVNVGKNVVIKSEPATPVKRPGSPTGSNPKKQRLSDDAPISSTPVKEQQSHDKSPHSPISENWLLPKKQRRGSSISTISELNETSIRNSFECLSGMSDANVDNDSIFDDANVDNDSVFDDANVDNDSVFDDADIECSRESNKCCPDPEKGNSSNENGNSSQTTNDVFPNAPNAGRFMSNQQIFECLNACDCPLDSIPNGRKEDVFFVLSNRNEFADDCGVWDSESGTTVNQAFTVNESNLTCVYIKHGKYCSKKVTNRKLTYTELNPQPTNIIHLHRYYAKLKENDKYKKRVTKVTQTPETHAHLLNMSVTEYCGCNNKRKTAHGNSKTSEPYTRTDPVILRRTLYKADAKKATEIVHDMCFEDSVCAPKSSRKVQDKIYREKLKENKLSNPVSHRNLADDLLEVISSIHTNPYVQEVTLTKNKQSIVIVYSHEQITDLKRNCTGSDGSILGVDRTFNLGKFFITSFSYKNRSFFSRKTNLYPIMMGPSLIHWDGEQATYSNFFSHLRDRLGKDNLTIGSDEEKAMTNGLHDNIRRFLEKNGSNQKDREDIIRTVFDRIDGVVFAKNDIEYAKRVDDLYVYFQRYPKFGVHWERYLETKLRKYVYEPLRDKSITKLWTNNNSESLNNRLKQVADWKQHGVMNIVGLISKVANIQLLDLRRALYGAGNYKLVDSSRAMSSDVWHSKTQDEKDKLFVKSLQAAIPVKRSQPEDNIIKSSRTNFKVIIPKVNAGKKPGQRRRQHAERANDHR